MKRILSAAMAVLFAVALGACSSAKAPAEKAIKAAEEALNAAKAEAMKYVPEQVRKAEDALKAAKDNFEKRDYPAAVSAANAVLDKAKDLVSSSASRKAELSKNWEELSAGLPKSIAEIKSRITALSRSRKLPKGLDKAKIESAKSGIDEVGREWDEAGKAFKEGRLAEAVAKAKDAREKADGIMSALGMKVTRTEKG